MSRTQNISDTSRQGKPRRKLFRRYEIPNQIRFLTFSCYQRLPLLSNDAIKEVFVQRLVIVQKQQSINIIAWVVMPEHVHLLVQPTIQDYPVDEFLRSLKRPVAQRVLHRWQSLNATSVLEQVTTSDGQQRFWLAGGGYDRNINSEQEMNEKLDYIHQNPLQRGLVKRATDWKWSSASWYAGDRSGKIVINPVL